MFGLTVVDFENIESTVTTTRTGKLTELKLDIGVLKRGTTGFDIINNTEKQAKPLEFEQHSLDPFAFATSNTPFTLELNDNLSVNTVSITMGDYGDDFSDNLIIQAFDEQGVLIGEVEGTLLTDGIKFTSKTLTLTTDEKLIHSLKFIGGTDKFPNSVFYDNLSVSYTPSSTANILLSTRDSKVGSFDPLTGAFTSFLEGVNLTDIASSDRDEIFGITFSQLYKIDPVSGQFSLIGNLGGSSFNALGFTSDNILYAAGGSKFYKVDTKTGKANLVSDLGSSFLSHGDLVFDPDNEYFWATSKGSTSDVLYKINLDGTAVKVGNIGYKEVFGLSLNDDGNLFGYTSKGQQILINEQTGLATLEQNITGLTGAVGGATNWV
ncbi:hypothetical protein Sta7437_3419 [Stanieria cyanosphaera PCC 7437]|uniref:Uncharacterized protein n=1 Tax=Stanieria cyanosphaera (strain ATCC 29371 / PCC 7437) TaxID=111780 RepID=K9XZ28_STAC7|nr:hypothetical protein [Stanieria cyanosphaera]AFZ36922.1 hypothetical protein Sta7437_3419 [Stanieria cyanosphaera PCC 7437]